MTHMTTTTDNWIVIHQRDASKYHREEGTFQVRFKGSMKEFKHLAAPTFISIWLKNLVQFGTLQMGKLLLNQNM